jgi:hypothetical protein
MKNQAHNLSLFRAITGKTTISPKAECINPFGYQVARVDKIKRYGGME